MKTTSGKIGMRVNKNSNRTIRRKQPHKAWYNTDSEHSRKHMIKCKNNYRQNNSDGDLCAIYLSYLNTFLSKHCEGLKLVHQNLYLMINCYII